MRVSDDNAGHEEPLIAALYNNTFQVVCFASCQDSECMHEWTTTFFVVHMQNRTDSMHG